MLHGAKGMLAKGLQPGNATMYYSETSLKTQGKLRIGGTEVNGTHLAFDYLLYCLYFLFFFAT